MTLSKSGSTLKPFWVYKPIIFTATGPKSTGGHHVQPNLCLVFITQKINQRQVVDAIVSPAPQLFILFAALHFTSVPSEKLASLTPENNLLTLPMESWKFKKAKTNIRPPQLGEKKPHTWQNYTCISHDHKNMGFIPSKDHRKSFGEICKLESLA